MTSTKASIQQRQDDERHYCVAVRFDHVVMISASGKCSVMAHRAQDVALHIRIRSKGNPYSDQRRYPDPTEPTFPFGTVSGKEKVTQKGLSVARN
jgi:hypothetical protein